MKLNIPNMVGVCGGGGGGGGHVVGHKKSGHPRSLLTLRNAFVNVQVHILGDPFVNVQVHILGDPHSAQLRNYDNNNNWVKPLSHSASETVALFTV